MRLLLDTHIFLWFISGDKRMPYTTQEVIRKPDNEVFLSVVSLWGAVVKYQLGKLPLPQPPERYLPVQRERHGINSLPLDEASVRRLANLALFHRDPFDRMLVCQALEHDLIIVTIDDAIRAYPARTL
ncbi:MAG TPA: type II toxin-antitoxin system VapC family toxin [Chloroflexia bacterium]|jgi:PIN domain nuclease of toxin-antitoxin system